MPVSDVEAAQNFYLDSMLDPEPPGGVAYGLLSGDPRAGGVELGADGGYARVAVADYSTFWTPADAGVKTSALLLFADATGAWSGPATYWGLWVGGTLWRFGKLDVDDPLYVTAAGPAPKIRIAVKFATALAA